MRRLFLLLAMLAAMVSGWTPALAATQQAGMAVLHAAHGPVPPAAGHHRDGHHRDGQSADAQQAAQSPGGEHPDTQGHGAQHPLLCSACFAVVAESEAPPAPFAKADATLLPVTIFFGGEVLPPVPPPRPVQS